MQNILLVIIYDQRSDVPLNIAVLKCHSAEWISCYFTARFHIALIKIYETGAPAHQWFIRTDMELLAGLKCVGAMHRKFIRPSASLTGIYWEFVQRANCMNHGWHEATRRGCHDWHVGWHVERTCSCIIWKTCFVLKISSVMTGKSLTLN